MVVCPKIDVDILLQARLRFNALNHVPDHARNREVLGYKYQKYLYRRPGILHVYALQLNYKWRVTLAREASAAQRWTRFGRMSQMCGGD